MRETRLSGSEGGAGQLNAPSLPLSSGVNPNRKCSRARVCPASRSYERERVEIRLPSSISANIGIR